MIIFRMSIKFEIAKLVNGLDFIIGPWWRSYYDMHHVSIFVLSYAHVAGYFNKC